jgi:diacylglycerol kinase family enzyme
VVNIDGEAVKLKKTLKVKVIPNSLNVIIPGNGQKK